MKPVLFSVSYAGLWGQHFLDLKSFIGKAAALGYPAVELMAKRPHLSILDADGDSLRALRDTARECGVEIATIAAYTDFTNGKSAAEVPFGEMQVAYVERCAEIAAALEAKIVRVFTGYSTGLESAQQDWNTCVRATRECAERAAGHGVILGVQNHHDTAIAWESYLEFLSEVDHPNCKAMFDPWAPALHGDEMEACAKALAPMMVQTTLADYVRLRRFNYLPSLVNYAQQPDAVRAVPLGEGFVDLAPFFAGLKAGGFDGYVAYEMCSPLRGGGSEANLDDAARRSLARIRELMG
jgi:sugar phosphate isomerase/epimerase